MLPTHTTNHPITTIIFTLQSNNLRSMCFVTLPFKESCAPTLHTHVCLFLEDKQIPSHSVFKPNINGSPPQGILMKSLSSVLCDTVTRHELPHLGDKP